jgi:hypothetical protein
MTSTRRRQTEPWSLKLFSSIQFSKNRRPAYNHELAPSIPASAGQDTQLSRFVCWDVNQRPRAACGGYPGFGRSACLSNKERPPGIPGRLGGPSSECVAYLSHAALVNNHVNSRLRPRIPGGRSGTTELGSERRDSPGAEWPRQVNGQADRPISTGQLNASQRLHLLPIHLVIFQGSSGRPHLGGGFPLRCFQRLSFPNIATQRCRWRDNWCTRGSSIPVLSY